ncbi:MAG: trypsin-like peptidase domain-containing protein, partial [Pirellulaceae bacterium]|nr:trypsin-like peptidase domain-containing protein [Pirellulaceae bacterium]
MDILCTCASCGAKFKLPQQAAGKRVPCTKCGGTIEVPAGTAGASFKPSGAGLPVAKAIPQAVQKPKAMPPPPRPAVPPVATAATAPSFDAPSILINADAKKISADAKKGSSGPPVRPPGRSLAFVLGGSGAVIAILVLVGLGAILLSGGKKPLAKPGGKAPAKTVANSRFTVDLPKDRRNEKFMVQIDGKQAMVPATGPVVQELPAGKHSVLILRRGYEQISFNVELSKDEKKVYKPAWKEMLAPSPVVKPDFAAANTPDENVPTIVPKGFTGWQQLFGMAKELAAARKKGILLVLGSSDGSLRTARLAAKLQDAGLPGGALAARFVPLIIDFPTTEEGFHLVLDPAQNEELRLEYNVFNSASLPLLALLDAQGRPYAVQREWPDGFDALPALLEKLDAQKSERDRLLEAAAAGTPQEQLAGAAAAMKWIDQQEIVAQYHREIHDWYELALRVDPENKAGHLEVLLEGEFYCSLRNLDARDLVGISRRLGILDPWLKGRRFTSSDRGFRLHLITAGILTQMEDDDPQGMAHLTKAAEYKPDDAELRKQWQVVSSGVISSGTGFVVAEGGYLLTNRHVVQGKGRTAVRIPDVEQPLPATVVKIDEQRDIALLKVEFPAAFQPALLPLAPGAASQSMAVAAYGYPLSSKLGEGTKSTQGTVNDLPNPASDQMLLLDIKINGGNSGGPLCDIRGNVVGMITQKTRVGGFEDSYGMAIPADELIKFLDE